MKQHFKNHNDAVKMLSAPDINSLNALIPITELFIFKTIDEEITVTFANGMKLPISKYSYYGSKRGVFIIKRFNIPHMYSISNDEIISFLKTSKQNFLIENYIKKIDTGINSCEITIEVFIPENDLLLYKDIFSPLNEVLVSYENIEVEYPEPLNLKIGKDTFKYEVVNTSDKRDYYFKVGNHVRVLKSVIQSKPDGLYIHFKNKSQTKKIYFPLDEMSKGGVYTDRYQAITNGNFDTIMSQHKIESEIIYLNTSIKAKEEMLRLDIIKAEHNARIKNKLGEDQLRLARKKQDLEETMADKKNLGIGMSLLKDALSFGTKFL